MKKRLVAGCATILACICFLSEPVFAGPRLISYQGKLTDNTGTPVEGDKEMRFILFDRPSDGEPFWKETQNVPVTGGIYDVRLGSESPLDTALFAGDTLYLQVEIYNGYDWEILSPRQQLTSTAYSFMAEKAADADTLGGKSLAQIHADETDPTVLASVKDGVAWNEVSGIPPGFADGDDANSGGDITGVAAGTGLTGGGISGDVTVSVNISAIQQRVTGTCEAGSSIRTVNENGSVVCEADDLGITSESDPQVGTISTNYVPRWDGSALVSGTMYDTGAGRIGIGTTTPNEQIELTGNLRLPTTTATTGIIKAGSATLIHTYGSSNFFAGTNAGNLTTTGFYNAASGSYALYSNTTGRSNTASGSFALRNNTTGYSNTASGDSALYSNTSGNRNTASGYIALHNNTTGISNTASGSYALDSNTTGNNNTASGTYALSSNTTGGGNTANGIFALQSNNGDVNTASGYSAGYNNTVGSNNTFVGALSDAASNNLTNATALGYNAVVSGSNQVRIGNTAVTQIGGQVGWSNLSDMRVKKDIGDIGPGLDFITALRPVQFRMIDGNDRLDFGFIAQDIEALLGEDYNILGIEQDSTRTLSLRYTDFIAPMVKAMQEQQGQIEEQQEQIEEQKKIIERQEGFMSAMRSEMDAMKAEIQAIRAGK